MAIRKLARMGHPVLKSRAAEVGDLDDPELSRLITDMIDTMEDEGGVGIAAPQVYASLRVIVFMVPAERLGEGAGEEVPLTVLVNPVIERMGDEMESGWEGCLSVPGLRGAVPRYKRIRYKGLAPDGRPIERIAEGFHARVLQHECDHLDGILYPRRMRDLSSLHFVSEMRHNVALEQ